jgi:hypothetical protein
VYSQDSLVLGACVLLLTCETHVSQHSNCYRKQAQAVLQPRTTLIHTPHLSLCPCPQTCKSGTALHLASLYLYYFSKDVCQPNKAWHILQHGAKLDNLPSPKLASAIFKTSLRVCTSWKNGTGHDHSKTSACVEWTLLSCLIVLFALQVLAEARDNFLVQPLFVAVCQFHST